MTQTGLRRNWQQSLPRGMTQRVRTAHRTRDFDRTDHSAGHRGLLPSVVLFRPRKSPQLPRQTRLCQRVSTRQVSARQSQRDELIRSRTTSTTEATTKVTNCHSNIVIQSEVKLDSTFKAGATRGHLSQWAKLTSDKFILSAVAGSTI